MGTSQDGVRLGLAEHRRFQEINVGDVAECELDVTEALIDNFAELTGDVNPLHVDAQFAKQSPFQQRIAHGMLIGSFFSRLIGMNLPGQNALYLSQAMRFRKPVGIGTRIKPRIEVVGKSESSRTLQLKTTVLDSYGDILIEGEAEVMVMDSDTHESVAQAAPAVMLDLSGRTCLVTGASRGIGAAIARQLSACGARVAINYSRDRDAAEKLLQSLKEINPDTALVQADVRDPGAVEEMVRQVVERFGGVDILVNNAFSELVSTPFLDTPWSEFQRCWDVVVGGAVNCSKAVVPYMTSRKYGKIINISTIYTRNLPPTRLSAYVAAKTALEGLTRALAVELGPTGIRVNAVAPGLTETSLSQFLPARIKDVVAVQTPLRRNAEPEDTAQTVAFLASSASDFLTGATIPVCGGQVMF
jgi:3-oxoacyl-[acyl-carrier protein] reductase